MRMNGVKAIGAGLCGVLGLLSTGLAQGQQRESDALEEVTVFGRGRLEEVRDIPQTVTSIDQELLLENTVETTLDNVVRFIPSASPLLAEYGVDLNLSVRGFDVSQIWNGMPLRSVNQSPSLANVERVEVLMGPASVLYGSMEPGGVINIVTKQPLDTFHFASGVDFGSYDAYGGDIDVGGPFSDRVRGRLNLAYDTTGAEFDFYERERTSIAPVISVDLNDATSLILDALYLRTSWPEGVYENSRPVIGTLLPNPDFGPISERFNPAYLPGFTSSVYQSWDLSARLSHEISDTLSLNAAVAYHHDERDDNAIFAGFGFEEDGRTVARFPFIADGETEDYTAHIDLKGELTTGPVRHDYMLGADFAFVDSFTSYLNSDNGIPPIDVYDPVYQPEELAPFTPELVDSRNEVREFAVVDRMRFNEQFTLLLGLRHSDFLNRSNFAPQFDETAWSTQVGLVYQPSSRISWFVSRNESFVPRFELDLNNVPFEPEESLQYEIGAKLDVGSTGLAAGITAFYIEKPNVLAIAPDDPSNRIPAGAVEAQGLELSLQGKPLPGWSLYTGYGYTKTEVTEATEFTVTGAEFGNAPKHTFSVLSNYELQEGALRGLGIHLAYQYMGTRWADAANTLKLPSYSRLDLSASYPVTERVTVSLHGNHLTDEKIYSNAFSPDYTYVGIGRTYTARMRYQF
jgi:iron complex outermembrane receptor protein